MSTELPTQQPDTPTEQLTPERITELTHAIAGQLQFDPTDAQLLKFTNNAVFRLPAAKAVVRIAGSATMTRRVQKVIRVARWFQHHDVRAVRLLPVDQPIVVDGLTATLWAEVPNTGPAATGADLANILTHIHGLPPPPAGLPRWAPLQEIRQRLDDPEGVSASDVAYLSEQCDQLEEHLAKLEYTLPEGPIHGDAFIGNLITAPDGPVICDFDSSCIGPREWDLTPLAVGRLRFDYPGDEYGPLTAQYGFDVITWPGFPTLRRLRELKLVTSLVPVLNSRPTLRAQWQHRFDTFRAGDEATRWSAYGAAA